MPDSIERVPGRCGGQPVIKGTRIEPKYIWVLHKNGHSVEEIKEYYPHLTHYQITEAVKWCENNPQHRNTDEE